MSGIDTPSRARTLLQMAGANPSPAKLSEAVVVIIDAQDEYVSGKVPLIGVETALDRIADLLKAARGAGTPIVHVVHRGSAGGIFDPDGPGYRISAQAAPLPGETVIEKTLPNSFAKTTLQSVIQATGKTTLVLAGFMTHMCVSATARSALDYGYSTTIAADAAATRSLPDPLGGSDIPAAQIHRSALAELADRFATIAPVSHIKA